LHNYASESKWTLMQSEPFSFEVFNKLTHYGQNSDFLYWKGFTVLSIGRNRKNIDESDPKRSGRPHICLHQCRELHSSSSQDCRRQCWHSVGHSDINWIPLKIIRDIPLYHSRILATVVIGLRFPEKILNSATKIFASHLTEMILIGQGYRSNIQIILSRDSPKPIGDRISDSAWDISTASSPCFRRPQTTS
jgi:hypothetical protein